MDASLERLLREYLLSPTRSDKLDKIQERVDQTHGLVVNMANNLAAHVQEDKFALQLRDERHTNLKEAVTALGANVADTGEHHIIELKERAGKWDWFKQKALGIVMAAIVSALAAGIAAHLATRNAQATPMQSTTAGK